VADRSLRAPVAATPFRTIGIVALLVAAGAAIPFAPPRLVVLGTAALVLAIAVIVHPRVAAYALIGITPLVAGIDRGRLVPVLRPAEALALLVGVALIARGLLRIRSGSIPRIRLSRIDVSILLVAVTSSIVPLAWMVARNQTVTQDDLLYALMIWKYYGVFLIVRAAVRTEGEVRTCLWISMASAALVAVLAVLQSLQLFGVTRTLSGLYTAYGSVQALHNNRGGSTLSLPIAVADLMVFNLAIAVGFLLRARDRSWILYGAAALFVMGVIAAGEFSGAIALILGLVTLALITLRARVVAAFVPALLAAGMFLRPVIEKRLMGFQSASGLPVSWQGRIYNLTNYFWPQLASHGNFILGVRVSARVSTSTMATGYIWIESGYTWLLWSGGIPLLCAFAYFLWVNLRASLPRSRRDDAVGVAALAVSVGLIVIAVLMLIDPHLTYRGSADLLFALLALAGVGAARSLREPQSGEAALSASEAAP
jgi:hypothetical protein